MGFFDKWSKPKTPQTTPQEQLNTSNSKASTLNKATRIGLTTGVIAGGGIDAITGQETVQQDTTDQNPPTELVIDNPQDEAQKYAEKHGLPDAAKKPTGNNEQKVPQAEVNKTIEEIGKKGLSPDYSNPENIPTRPTADTPEEDEGNKNIFDQYNRTEQPQPTSDSTQTLDTESPAIVDINGNTPLDIGGKTHWESLAPTPSQKDGAEEKSTWLDSDKHDIKVSPDGKTET